MEWREPNEVRSGAQWVVSVKRFLYISVVFFMTYLCQAFFFCGFSVAVC